MVIELRFGQGRYVLTSDLSDPSWDVVASVEPELHLHTGNKLPHHGSGHAQPPALLQSAGYARTWALTPYNRGRETSKLPTVAGLRSLLEHEPAVHMTAFPVGWQQLRPAPERVAVGQLQIDPVRLGEDLGGLIVNSGRSELAASDCFWMFSFDDAGRLTRSVRGGASTRVERD